MAIILDGELLSAFTIKDVVREKAVITGKFTLKRAEEIASALGGE